MMEWERARDYEFKKYTEGLGDSSYDLVFRDLWFKNGRKADLARYRHSNFEFEVFGVYGVDESPDMLIDSLHDILTYLSDEDFNPRVATKRTDNMRFDEEESIDIEEDYFFNSSKSFEEIESHLSSVLAPEQL